MVKSKTFFQIRKWAIFLIIATILSILQSTPGLFEFFGIRPILLLPFAISFSMFCNEKSAAFMGLFCGALWDCSSGRLFGYSSVILIFCGVAVSMICSYIANRNLLNAMVLIFCALLIYNFFDFLFRYVIWNFDYTWSILVFHMLPTIVYTVLISPILYLFYRWLYVKLTVSSKNIDYLG